MLKLDIELQLGDFGLDVNLEAGRELISLFGYSGSGKTLTLEAIAGLRKPDRGRITIDGDTVFDSAKNIDVPAHRRGIGYLIQEGALFPHLTTARNVGYGLGRASRADREARVLELLELLDLAEFGDRYPSTLSGGQKQRVALARALAPKPRTLLLDEPFAALDAATRETLGRELFKLREELDLTILFVTHDLSEAFSLGERIAVFDGGTILQTGSNQNDLPIAEIQAGCPPDRHRKRSRRRRPGELGKRAESTHQGLHGDNQPVFVFKRRPRAGLHPAGIGPADTQGQAALQEQPPEQHIRRHRRP